MRIALISSEVVPLAKTGGLADVVGGLARALRDLGAQPVVILPRYRGIDPAALTPIDEPISLVLGGRAFEVAAFEARLPGDVGALLIDAPTLFGRRGLYGEKGEDYRDNCLRFATLCRGALELLRRRQPCDIIHAHDWQAALAPVYLKSLHAADSFFAGSRGILTIHNLAYQGTFPPEDLASTGLDSGWMTPRVLEFYGRLNLLKAAIVTADAVTTVSPTYAREIRTPENGCGLDGVLRDREGDLVGIRNGIDTGIWDPRTDPLIPVHYGPRSLPAKGRCRAALRRRVGLTPADDGPLFAVISRLVHQKGIDLLVEAFPEALEDAAQWVVVGAGDADLEADLQRLARRNPERVAVHVGFDEELAHLTQAGADYVVMPSRFEPCGLNQMYAQRYGTVPVVTAVGGLVDTVVDVIEEPQRGTGVVFDVASRKGLLEGLARARGLWRRPRVWTELRRRGMAVDFSWEGSARRYLELYERVLSRPRTPIPPRLG